jgi:putative ABC transport system ATP-binding protein
MEPIATARVGAAVTTLIETRDLHKLYQMGRQTVRAVDGVDLALEKGGFQAIMGPSGSGKSTLLYLLGGLDRPTSGQIVADGEPLQLMDENHLAEFRRHKVGFIFQAFNLIPSLSALENVAYPLRFAGVPRWQRHTIARDLLQRVGLGDRLQHKPTELSGGQQQRVAVARALVNDPQLILADEPTGNLDTTSGHAVMQLLAELHQQGRTVLVVTHDPRMMAYATETLYMLDGRIVPQADYEAATQVGLLEQPDLS